MNTHTIFHIKRYVAVFSILLVVLYACNKDTNPPQASEKSMYRYVLPQGNAPFDKDIVNYFNLYNTYILYKFSDVDFNYMFSYNLANPALGYNINGKQGPVVMRGADSIAIPAALDFLKQYCFDFYPEDFKKKFLPQKILLAGLIYTTRWNGTTRVYDTPRVNPVIVPIEGADHITLPKIDTAFITLPLANKLILKGQFNQLFLKHLMFPAVSSIPARIPEPTDFYKISDYTLSSVTTANKNKYGFITLGTANRAPVTSLDLLSFLDTICGKPKTALDAYMLNPKVDSLGLTKRKYDYIVGYFKNNYNVDIQAIGNKQN